MRSPKPEDNLLAQIRTFCAWAVWTQPRNALRMRRLNTSTVAIKVLSAYTLPEHNTL
jgi:hypothetical protein